MITFASLRKPHASFFRRKEGLSHERVTGMWTLALLLALFLIMVGGAYAAYVFMDIEKADTIVLTEPIETTRYNDAQIRAVLEDYRARAVLIKKNRDSAPIPLPPPVVSEPAIEEPSEVAPVGDVTVE